MAINLSVPGNPLVGQHFTFRPNLPVWDDWDDDENGIVVVAPGMGVTVQSVYHDWNGVPGLTMLYVYCGTTGLRTHVTLGDLCSATSHIVENDEWLCDNDTRCGVHLCDAATCNC